MHAAERPDTDVRARWSAPTGATMSAIVTRMASVGRTLFCFALIGFGGIGLFFADTPVQWPPPPDLSAIRAPLGIVTALLLAAAGVGLQLARTQRISSYLGAVAFLLWAAFLHGPKLPGAWHAVAECVALAVGALACLPRRTARSFDLSVRYPFGLCLIAFGAAHFVYSKFTIAWAPDWIPPGPAFWVYATGAGLVAAGVSLLTNLLSRVAATLVGVTFSSFVLFVHVPRVSADLHNRLEWTVLCVACALTGAAWVIAGAMEQRAPAESRVS